MWSPHHNYIQFSNIAYKCNFLEAGFITCGDIGKLTVTYFLVFKQHTVCKMKVRFMGFTGHKAAANDFTS